MEVCSTTRTRNAEGIQTWWESISKARTQIESLSCLLPESSASSLSVIADSDHPALSLLSSAKAYSALSLCLSSAQSSDPLTHWLYDTYLSNDPNLRLVTLTLIPLITGLYFTRIHSNSHPDSLSLSGFEAVLLAVYSNELKSRAGKPVLVNVPDLSLPSLYHTPRKGVRGGMREDVGVIWPVLEPQLAVKSTKRALIVGVVLDCYFKVIGQMPSWSKIEFCEFVNGWAGQECCCKDEVDDGSAGRGGISVSRLLEYDDEEDEEIKDGFGNLRIENGDGEIGEEVRGVKGVRIPLPWEILQPALRILGHCLLGPLNSQDVRDAASVAVRSLYARASHDLNPQAILATRSLIQLDKRAREAAKMTAVTSVSSAATTPSKAKKPEVLLVSK